MHTEEFKHDWMINRQRHYINRGIYRDNPEAEVAAVKLVQAGDKVTYCRKVNEAKLVSAISEYGLLVAERRLQSLLAQGIDVDALFKMKTLGGVQ